MNALEMAIDFGRSTTVAADYVHSVTVEGPAVVAGTHKSAMAISSPPDPSFHSDVTLIVYGPHGNPLASLPMVFSERTHGIRGVEVTGTDQGGGLRMRMRLTQGVLQMDSDFAFKVPEGARPAGVAQTVRFLSHLKPGNRVGYRMEGSQRDAAASVSLEMSQVVPEAYADFLEQLARIQSHAHTYFPIPETIGIEDFALAAEVDTLLNGRAISVGWTRMAAKLRVQDAVGFEASLSDQPQAFKLVMPRVVRLCGVDIDIGPVEWTLGSALITNRRELLGRVPFTSGMIVSAVLQPAENNQAVMKRLESKGAATSEVRA
jgi:hypothetical protein